MVVSMKAIALYLEYATVQRSGQDYNARTVANSILQSVETHFTGNSTPPQLCVSQSVLMVNASTLVNATAMLVTKELAAMSVSILNIVCSSSIPLVQFHILGSQVFAVWF